MHEWQKELSKGIKKGHMPIVAMGRRSGKSMFWYNMMMQANFMGSWTNWRKVFVWPWDKKASISGKKIWGKINYRRNKLVISSQGTRLWEYATDKEVFTKRLKDGGDGW